MAFRHKRDEWDDFLSRHSDAVIACGVPAEVISNKMRFLVFLDHGCDEWGWAENPHAFFNSESLTDEQIAALADLVSEHVDDSYRVAISSRWQRSSCSDETES